MGQPAGLVRADKSNNMDPLIYNVPVDLASAYRGQRLIVRACEPASFVDRLGAADLANLQYVQILELAADMGILASWGRGVPVDLVMREPMFEHAKLYSCARLLDKHPVRVTIPVRSGLAKAVKIAASLNFAVKLSVDQPEAADLAEMFAVLQMFLHGAGFSQPVEFYQGFMQALLHGTPATVWTIQEEDPSRIRYITDDGTEIISPRFFDAKGDPDAGFEAFIDNFEFGLITERRECERCEFLAHCRGYFKWPDKNYICGGGIKNIFDELKYAAVELKRDLALYSKLQGEMQP
jgi:hypothetical protein